MKVKNKIEKEESPPIVGFIKQAKAEEIALESKTTDTLTIIPPDVESDIEGDFDRDDFNLPALILKHGVDQRFADINPGNFVYSVGSEEYYCLAPPLTLDILKLHKRYLQKIDQGQGERPQIAQTKEEVEALGGTLDPANPEGILFQPVADMLVLINGSKTNKAIASLEVLGSKCAPAMYRAKGTAYGQTAKVVLTTRTRLKMAGKSDAKLTSCRWVLGVKQRQGATFSYLVPTLVAGPENSPERMAALQEIAANL
jgi:hypothetical protein